MCVYLFFLHNVIKVGDYQSRYLGIEILFILGSCSIIYNEGMVDKKEKLKIEHACVWVYKSIRKERFIGPPLAYSGERRKEYEKLGREQNTKVRFQVGELGE